MQDQKKTIGLVGLGYWGKNLLRNLDAMGVLALACDASSEILAGKDLPKNTDGYTGS